MVMTAKGNKKLNDKFWINLPYPDYNHNDLNINSIKFKDSSIEFNRVASVGEGEYPMVVLV